SDATPPGWTGPAPGRYSGLAVRRAAPPGALASRAHGGSMKLLEGYVALDLTDLRGQFCGKLLRDLGMEVVKVEPPDGDTVRRLEPFAHARPDPEGSLRFASLNAGKQSVVLDLTRPADREELLRLVRRADVLVESFDPGTMAALGLDEARLREHNS